MSGPGRKPTGPSAAEEPRDRFGIPGKVGKPSAPGPNTIDSSELERNLGAAGNAFGASGAIQGVRRGAAAVKGVNEFAAGRKAAPAAAQVAERAAPSVSVKRAAPSVNVKRAEPNPKIMEQVNDSLKTYKTKLAARDAANEALKTRARPKAEIKRNAIGRADTLDESGGAMKRGGAVKKYASGGSASSRADGVAQRGKTRGTMMCSGGMAKGRK
jgi:hypothetical protein